MTAVERVDRITALIDQVLDIGNQTPPPTGWDLEQQAAAHAVETTRDPLGPIHDPYSNLDRAANNTFIFADWERLARLIDLTET